MLTRPTDYYIGPCEVVTEDGVTFRLLNQDAFARVDLSGQTALKALTPGGMTFYAFDRGFPVPLGYTKVGEIANPNADQIDTKPVDKAAWLAATGVMPVGDSIADALIETLTDQADETGQVRSFPLAPRTDGTYGIHLAHHSRIAVGRFGDRPGHVSRVTGMLAYEFGRREQASRGKPPEQGQREREQIEKDMTVWLRKLRLSGISFTGDDLLPPRLRGVLRPRPFTTTINDGLSADNFTSSRGTFSVDTGNTELDCTALGSAGFASCSHNTTLSGADHWVECEFISASRCGLCYRHNGTGSEGETTYMMEERTDGTNVIFFKVTSGSLTVITTSITGGSGPFFRAQINGSDHEFFDGSSSPAASSFHTATDASIGSGNQVGAMATGTSTSWQNPFQAADIVAAGGPPAGSLSLLGVGI